MPRQRIIWFAISLLILSSLACNAFAGNSSEPSLELPPPPITETDIALTPDGELGLAPTATLPSADPTDAPLVDPEGNPLLEALVDVNIRTGPGVQYDRDGFLFAGETVRAIGRDPVSGWWKIECPGRSTGRECWVSGGAQYTKTTNGEGVPVAAVPPTPTPEPSPTPPELPDTTANLAVANGLLAYTDDAGLWLAELDLSQSPPVAGAAVQLVAAPNVERPLISPDGRKIAYVVWSEESSSLHVVNADGTENRALIASNDLPIAVEADTAVHIGQAQWLANSQELAFNTYMQNLIGPGVGEREDLWTVSLDGTLTPRFEAGQGGGTFDISRSNQVVFGRTESIARANLDGSGLETVVTFDFVNTASEYAYTPYPRWSGDGRFATVAIPTKEQWSADAGAALWRIPANGPAELLESLPGNILFNPVQWSPDGSRLAYVLQEVDASNPPPSLTLTEGDGRNPGPYASDAQLTLYGWSSDNGRFLYAGANYYAVGQVGALPTIFETAGATVNMQWLTPASFIAATGAGNVWNLHSADLEGDATLLATITADFTQFDTWTP
ncbi:MAG: hypothetical protein GY803_19005 [Chloroflexi bacterium]|nr:hypothetical protein [Chloroflexota bacterium]